MSLTGWQPKLWRHTWTEDPVSAVWQDLGVFAYPANVLRYLQSPPGTERPNLGLAQTELQEKANEVAVCVGQGRDFFKLSQSASAETAPLVAYYGALCLAKAVAIANLPDVRHDDSGFKYHGLNSKWSRAAAALQAGLQQYEGDTPNRSVPKEYAIVDGGVFPRFVEALTGSAPEPGRVVYLEDLLLRLPCLEAHAALYSTKPCAVAQVYAALQPAKDAPTTSVLAVLDTDAARVRHDLLSAGFTEEPGLYHEQARRFGIAEQDAEKVTALGIESCPGGPNYIYGHVPGTDAWWPQAALSLAALWILSEVVRYRPLLWRRAIAPDGSGLLPLLEALLSEARRTYPNYILTALEGRRVDYGSPAYLT